MVRALTQLLASGGVLAASFAGVAWIVSLRPVDPPILRTEGLRHAVRAHELRTEPRVALSRRLPGSTEAWQSLVLRAEVPGTVRLVHPALEPGARVGTSDPSASEGASVELLHIDLETYRLQRELAEERAKHARTQIAVQEAEIVRFAELVELGETNLALAQNALDRLQGRLGSGASGAVAISDQQVEDAVRQVGQARSNLATQRAALAVARENAVAHAALVAVAERELALAWLRERDARVAAPFEAYVAQRHVSDGAAVMAGQELLELRALDRLRVVVYVPAELYALFSPATRARVAFPGLVEPAVAARNGDELAALLAAAAPEVDAATRSVRVEFWMENPAGRLASPQLDGRLPAGLACEVEIELGALEHSLWLPEEALRLGGAGPQVVRITRDAGGELRAELVPVVLGFYQGGRYALRAGEGGAALRAGELVALGDLEVLRGGEALRLLAEDGGAR